MLHHIELYVSDLKASQVFWAELLANIGYEITDHWDDGFTLRDSSDTYLTFVQRSGKYASLEYHRCSVGLNHLAFSVEGRNTVDSLRQYCVDKNIPCLYEDRYPFANGGDEYYALFIEDPDRIKVEFVTT